MSFLRPVVYSLLGSLSLASFLGRGLARAGDDGANPQTAKAVEIRLVPDSSEPSTVDRGASINSSLLLVVSDKAAGISAVERDVYFRGLKLAAETPIVKQKEAAKRLQQQRKNSDPTYAQVPLKDFPQYVDLFRNPEAYRGRPVSLRGTIRRLTTYDPGKNSQGIAEVYEGWFYTGDSNSNPTVVIFTRKPAELSLGSDITDEIGVTGYFFKQYGYEAQNGEAKAPMLLAGTVEWRPGPRHFVFTPLAPSLYVMLTLALAGLSFGMWKTNRPRHIDQLLSHEVVDLTKLPPVDNRSSSNDH